MDKINISGVTLSDPSIATTLAGIPLDTCIMNASGCWCTTGEELDQIARTSAGAIVGKSCTINPRLGNEKPRLYVEQIHYQYISINSMGIPNMGSKFYIEYQPPVKKPFIRSIYPFTTCEMTTMLNDIDASQGTQHCKLVEINLSCPNLPTISTSSSSLLEKMSIYFDALSQTRLDSTLVGFKLAPLYDHSDFQAVADLLLRCDKARFITCSNSITNGLMIDYVNETTRIRPKDGLGGIGGMCMKPTALANVYNFHRLLGNKIDIIGCGGCMCDIDVFEHILCGAKAVQVGTLLMQQGPGCLDWLCTGLKYRMSVKKYRHIEEFRGKLKVV